MDLQGHPAALGKNLFQDPNQLFPFSLGDHCFLQRQMQRILVFKNTVRLPEQVEFKNTVLLQLQKNAVLIGIHELFRRILAGQGKFFDDLYRHRHTGKKLLPYGIFHLIDVLFPD